MSVNSKMTALADEIRVLSGTTETMSLDAMATHVGEANDEVASQVELLTQVVAALEGKAGGSSDLAKQIIERTITEISDDSVINIGDSAFYNYDSLITVNFPNVTSIDKSAFYSCNLLETVDFPNVINIDDSAFSYCTSLTTINFPNVINIGNSAFYYCTALTTINFPNVTDIGDYAFRCCNLLKTIDFMNITSIDGRLFEDCNELVALILRGQSVCVLNNCADLPTNTYIYVPASLVSSYEAAVDSNFVRIRALEDFTVDGTIYGELDWDKVANQTSTIIYLEDMEFDFGDAKKWEDLLGTTIFVFEIQEGDNGEVRLFEEGEGTYDLVMDSAFSGLKVYVDDDIIPDMHYYMGAV